MVLLSYETVKKQIDLEQRLDRIVVFKIEGNDTSSQATANVLLCPVLDVEPPKPLVDKTNPRQSCPRESRSLAGRFLSSVLRWRIWQRAVTIILATEGGRADSGIQATLL